MKYDFIPFDDMTFDQQIEHMELMHGFDREMDAPIVWNYRRRKNQHATDHRHPQGLDEPHTHGKRVSS